MHEVTILAKIIARRVAEAERELQTALGQMTDDDFFQTTRDARNAALSIAEEFGAQLAENGRPELKEAFRNALELYIQELTNF